MPRDPNAPPAPAPEPPKRVEHRSNEKSGAGIAAIVGAGVLLATTSLTIPSEGVVLHPYYDPGKVLTWCAGETEGKPKDAYTMTECIGLLKNRMSRDYAPAVARCAPESVTAERVDLFAALLDGAYNAGTAALCGSPMVAKVKAGDVRGACLAFSAEYRVEGMTIHGWFASARYRGKPMPAATMRAHGWHWTGRNWRKELPGLVTRRRKETALCLKSG